MRNFGKRCSICREFQSYSEFPLKPDNTRDRFCLGCKKAYQKNERQTISQREQIRKRIRTIKATTPCADCGRRYHYCAMDFDHREGEVKLFNLSSAWLRRGQDKVEQELAKCDIVCANCHRIRTHNRARHSEKAELAVRPKYGKFTLDQIDQIFKLYATGQYTHKQIAMWFGVNRSSISQILRGASHKKYHRKKGSSEGSKETVDFLQDEMFTAEVSVTGSEERVYQEANEADCET